MRTVYWKCQFQKGIRLKEGIPDGLQSNCDHWWLVQEWHGSNNDSFGNTSVDQSELSLAQCIRSLGLRRSVCNDVQCEIRCVNFMWVLDPTRALWQAFKLPGISDDHYQSTMGVIVVCLETHQIARENIGCTEEYLGALTTSLGVPTQSLLVPITSLWVPTTGLGAPGNTWNHSTAICEKRHLLWELCWCTLKSKLLLII